MSHRPLRHCVSCSTAAARKVSAAPSTTFWPNFCRKYRQLADRRRLADAVDPEAMITVGSWPQLDGVVAGLGDVGEQLDEALLERRAALDLADVASCSS